MRRAAILLLAAAAAAPACGGDRSLGPLPGGGLGATLAASTTLSCARFGGDACCWGDDGQGHVLPVPTRVPLPGAPTDIAVLGTLAEPGHTACALVAREVYCWSFQSAGPPTVEKLTGAGRATQIVGNDEHACALGEDGGVRCWGADYFGQLGDGRFEQGPFPPVAVVGLEDVVEIAAGEWHTCARTALGGVWCWGMGYGSGSGTCNGTTCSPTPVWVPLAEPAVRISAGGMSGCAQEGDGTVLCWQMENGAVTAPAVVPALAGAASVYPGYGLGCAIPGDHQSPICWGRVGYSSTLFEVDHAPVAGLGPIVEYASGWYHACARTEAGEVVCFGANDRHELGDGTTVDAPVPHATAGCDLTR